MPSANPRRRWPVRNQPEDQTAQRRAVLWERGTSKPNEPDDRLDAEGHPGTTVSPRVRRPDLEDDRARVRRRDRPRSRVLDRALGLVELFGWIRAVEGAR